MAKKIYVLDTSVYLTNAEAIYDFDNNDIVVPLKVLEEIDKHKNRQDSVGRQARLTIRILDELREKASLSKGVRLGKGKGIVKSATCKTSLLPPDLDPSVPDNKIISTALSVKEDNPNRKVILVTRDINMRVVADSIQFPVEKYDPEKAVMQSSDLYSGYSEILIDDEFIDRFMKDEVQVIPTSNEFKPSQFFPNQFFMLRSMSDHKKTILVRHIHNGRICKVRTKEEVFGIKARNKEQNFAIDLLLNRDVKIVSLVGRAGSGKTLTAIAAGLRQVLEGSEGYKKLVVSRPIQPLGKDIGFLPGDLNEKMLPWLTPVQDNLQFLLGNDKQVLEEFMKKGTIEIEALTYIRGRSIANAFIIIDEAQNLTVHELKTIITRVGEGTKIVLTGDIEQIDNVFINDVTNGLTHAVEKFKNSDMAGHITLTKGERSEVATLASEVL